MTPSGFSNVASLATASTTREPQSLGLWAITEVADILLNDIQNGKGRSTTTDTLPSQSAAITSSLSDSRLSPIARLVSSSSSVSSIAGSDSSASLSDSVESRPSTPTSIAQSTLAVTAATVESVAPLLSPVSSRAVSTEDSSKHSATRATSADISFHDITANDVIPGRGGRSNAVNGNQNYVRLVKSKAPAYWKPTNKRAERLAIVEEVLQEIVCRGGRFLRVDKRTGRYTQMQEDEIVKKIQQCFRTVKSRDNTLGQNSSSSKSSSGSNGGSSGKQSLPSSATLQSTMAKRTKREKTRMASQADRPVAYRSKETAPQRIVSV